MAFLQYLTTNKMDSIDKIIILLIFLTRKIMISNLFRLQHLNVKIMSQEWPVIKNLDIMFIDLQMIVTTQFNFLKAKTSKFTNFCQCVLGRSANETLDVIVPDILDNRLDGSRKQIKSRQNIRSSKEK
jgi:hypothetical protein